MVDTGNGMEESILNRLNQGEIYEDVRGRHIGIWNCRKRLEMDYGKDAKLTITSKPGEGTQVWVQIPKDRRGTKT